MTRRRNVRHDSVRRRFYVAARHCLTAVRQVWRALRPRGVPVEVLLADRAKRCAIEREISVGLRRLRRILGPTFPPGLAIIVQQTVHADRPLAGCYEVANRSDGESFALVRLALSVDGRRLGIDEVLAVLADQCCALAADRGGPREIVPFELLLAPAAPVEPSRPAALRSDPLAAHSNGRDHTLRAD